MFAMPQVIIATITVGFAHVCQVPGDCHHNQYGMPFLYHATRDCHHIQRWLCHMSAPLQMIVTTVAVGFVRC